MAGSTIDTTAQIHRTDGVMQVSRLVVTADVALRMCGTQCQAIASSPNKLPHNMIGIGVEDKPYACASQV
jgi:hypothetical protein